MLRKRNRRIKSQLEKSQVSNPFIDHYRNFEGGDDDNDIIFSNDTKKNCCYYLKCGCLFKQHDEYMDNCKTVFYIAESKQIELYGSQYFMRYSRPWFMDLLFQLQLIIDKEDKQMEFQNLIEDQIQADGLLNLNATHEDVEKFFMDARLLGLLGVNHIEQLHKFRQRMADVFGLTDKDNDHTLYKLNRELDEFWEVVNLEIESIEDEDLMIKARKWSQDAEDEMEQGDFHKIQMFIWEGKAKYDFDVERIQYQFYLRRNPCSRLCCLGRLIRKYKTRSRIQQRDPMAIHFGTGRVISNFYSQLVHALDLLSDTQLAWQFYLASQEFFDQSQGNDSQLSMTNHYSIGFTFVFMAIVGPYIIQYSSMTNAFHYKGYFQNEKYNSFIWIKRFYLQIAFTFLGFLILVILDILLKVESFLRILTLPLSCKSKRNKSISLVIRQWMEQDFFEKFFLLTSYEIDTFEKQKKFTQVLFEDLLLLVLQVVIQFDILKVNRMDNDKLRQSLIYSGLMTLLSIITNVFNLVVESQGLKEHPVEFIMLSMKAKQDWVPYGNSLMMRSMDYDINYSMIEFKIPLITDMFGFYKTFVYQFTDESLKKLTYQLGLAHSKNLSEKRKTEIKQKNQKNAASKEDISLKDKFLKQPLLMLGHKSQDYNQEFQDQIEKFVPKLKFGFSMYNITLNAFGTFVSRNFNRDPLLVWDKLDFNDIDWYQMIENQRRAKLSLTVPQTDGGKSILQVCIENENTDKGTWQLEPLMKLLLQQEKCDPNLYDSSNKLTLLSFCYHNKKHQAFKMMLELCVEDLDINQKNNTDKTTIFGLLFYNESLTFFHEQGYEPNTKLELLLKLYGDKIDRNIPQIDTDQIYLKVPIHYYIKQINKGEHKTLADMINSDKFRRYFGCNKFKLKDPLEIQQMMLLLFESKAYKAIAEALLDIAFKELGPFDEFIKLKDCQNYNFMHLVDCRYAPPFWIKYIKNQDNKALHSIVRDLLKQKNDDGVTPIQRHLSVKSLNAKAIQKLFNEQLVDQENKDTFKGHESEIMIGFIRHFEQLHSNEATRHENNIDRQKFFGSFKDKSYTYQKIKERFQIMNKSEIFEYYLKIDEMEQNFGSQVFSDNELNNQIKTLMTSKSYEDVQITKRNEKDNDQVIINSLQHLLLPQKQNQHERHIVLETFLNGLIEFSSIVDYVTDVIILYYLARSKHTMWFTFSLFTMLSPYYTVYASALTFQMGNFREKRSASRKGSLTCCYLLKVIFLIAPTFLIIMILLDIVYMILNVFAYAFLFLFILTPCRKRLHTVYEDFWDNLLKKTFGMSFMDLRGFKQQRTILQLQLESIPQIGFQIYLWYKIKDGQYPSIAKQLGNDLNAILISIYMAAFHLVLEMFNLYLESHTSKSTFYNYMVSCYNARQGWIPKQEQFNQETTYASVETSKTESFVLSAWTSLDSSRMDISRQHGNLIELDNQVQKFMGCIGYTVQFELSDSSMDYLMQYIYDNVPYVGEKSKKKLLYLGECIANVNLSKILQLLRMAYRKIDVLFDEQVLENIMRNNQINFLKKIKQPLVYHTAEDEEYYIVEMVQMSYSQVVKVMLKLGADSQVLSKKRIDYQTKAFDEPKTGLFRIAQRTGDKNMLFLIMASQRHQLDLCNDNVIHTTIRDLDFIQQEVALASQGLHLVQPLVLLDPEIFITWDQINSFIFRMSEYIQTYPDQARQRWHVIFGAFVPEIDYHENTQIFHVIEKIQAWVDCYPQKIKVQSNYKQDLSQLELDSQFLSQFVAIRRAFHLKKNDKGIEDNFHSYIDLEECLTEIDCSLEDVLNVYRIFHDQMKDLKKDQVVKCDRLIVKMGFDKQWGQYFYNSRNNLTDLTNKQLIIEQSTEFELKPVIIVPDDVYAIKDLRVYKSDAKDEPKYVNFKFEMQHYNGWLEKMSPPNQNVWNDKTGFQDDKQELLTVAINYDLNVEYQSHAFKLNLMSKIILNQIRNGHKITMQLFDYKMEEIQCQIKVKMFKKLE